MAPFFASILWTGHIFLWSFRALPAWLSTVTSCGVCRCPTLMKCARCPLWLSCHPGRCCTTLAVNTRRVHKEQVCEKLLLPPAESTSFACCYPSPFTLPHSAKEEASELSRLLPCRLHSAFARAVSETPLVRLCSETNVLEGGIQSF